MTNLWPRISPLLSKVEKPSRYLGQEWGSIDPKNKPDADYHAVMIYPDTYEIGQANQAVAILYDELNSDPRIMCERAYLPWVDMLALMRENDIELFTLETFRPIRECDFVGITLPHELCASNLLELLDVAKIPLHSKDRGEDDPFVFAGGPCAYNPEPFAEFIDAFFIGEGEELDLKLALRHRELRDAGATRQEILHEFAKMPSIYVPSMYEAKTAEEKAVPVEFHKGKVCTCVKPRFDDVPAFVEKYVIDDFDSTKALPCQIVPYSELVHDRLNIEILRGCARGCRFCQAGMIYRPVRERTCDNIVAAVADGMAATGYDEVSLTSLSSTDHSCIDPMLRRLQRSFQGAGLGISLPSQRVDSFGVKLAELVSGQRKTGLTLAPEAGTQRMRDIINKGVTEEDIFNAVANAFEAGWRRLKLYFMIGLPLETDEDVAGIGDLCSRVYELAKDSVPDNQRSQVRMTVSVALFIPKAMTPFQWSGQISKEEIQHRIDVLRKSMPGKGVVLHWHDAPTSYIEAVLARGGRECSALIETAWRNGARFDAWTEQFNFDAWMQAASEVGIDIFEAAGTSFKPGQALPWNHVSCGVRESFLISEWEKAKKAEITPDCTFNSCSVCGVCQDLDAKTRLEGVRRG